MSSLSDRVTHHGQSLASPFERWCETHDIHPNAVGAWEHYEWSLRFEGPGA